MSEAVVVTILLDVPEAKLSNENIVEVLLAQLPYPSQDLPYEWNIRLTNGERRFCLETGYKQCLDLKALLLGHIAGLPRKGLQALIEKRELSKPVQPEQVG